MKQIKLTVHLYYGGHQPAETKYTSSIDEARRWVADAEMKHVDGLQTQSMERLSMTKI